MRLLKSMARLVRRYRPKHAAPRTKTSGEDQ